MSAPAEGRNARASRAKPRLEERVCERGRRPTHRASVLLGLAEAGTKAVSASDSLGPTTRLFEVQRHGGGPR